MEKTSTGLQENVAGLLCYVAGWISGIVFLLLEKENKTVRFHAIQSIAVFGAITVVSIVLSWIPVIGIIISSLLSILALILWIILMMKAYQNNKFKLPWAGDFAEKKAA